MAYTTLVNSEELTRRLDDPDWVVFDCRFTLTGTEAGRRAYLGSHIPGARYAHLDEDLSGPLGPGKGRHPLPDPAVLAERLGQWGVGKNTQVVVYDDSFGSMAVRFWWLLRWLGHDSVALLDGGWPRWRRNQGPVTADLPTVQATVFHGQPRHEMCVEASIVDTARLDPYSVVLDARPEDRFTGERETLDTVAGHIPGSLNWPFEENLDLGGTFLPAEELREAYLELLNGRSPASIIHSCGSGVTACHNLLAMEIAGLYGSRLYAGSWSEWISNPAHPVETGNKGVICA
ncbi:MAG: sulfurtransferase [Burkholderiales bacterium]